LESDHQLKRNM